jgi:DNA-binding transcriptional ArsR family regulator
MHGDADIAKIGALVADPARARILLALGDGRALPASVLADEAGVAASTASAHLGKLVDGGLLTVESHGRHRYFALADERVGKLIEALARLAPAAPVHSLRQGTQAQALRAARTCYDHLAGRLGVALADSLSDRGHVALGTDGGEVTEAGQRFLDDFGAPPAPGRRVFCRPCLDWSERRPHLAGRVGAALACRCFELGWIARQRDTRAVAITAAGRDGLRDTFGIALDA